MLQSMGSQRVGHDWATEHHQSVHMGVPRWPRGKETATNERGATNPVSVTGSERSLGIRNSNLLQYSCLGNSMDRGAMVS